MKHIVIALLAAVVLAGCSRNPQTTQDPYQSAPDKLPVFKPSASYLGSAIMQQLEPGAEPMSVEGIKVSQLVQRLEKRGAVSWQTISDNEKVIVVESHDKVTGQNGRLQLVLVSSPTLKDKIVVARMVLNGLEGNQNDLASFLSVLVDEILNPK